MSDVLKQRSTAWRRRRLGLPTASRFKDILTAPKEKGRKWSKTAESYMVEKLSELIICQPLDCFTVPATRWGTDWEPEAFKAAIPVVEKRFDGKLMLPEGDLAFIEHPDGWCGCSPDGAIVSDKYGFGLLELKCYYNPTNFIDVLRSKSMPEKHDAQVQGSMWIAECDWYIFGAFDPRVKASGVDPLFSIKIQRDDSYINNEIAPKVIEFRKWIDEEYKKICPKTGPF